MRPCDKKFKMHFGWHEPYPKELAHLTSDGLHHGLDYLTPKGTPVVSPVNGVINFKGEKLGFGLCVYIKFWTGIWPFQNQYLVILAHLSTFGNSKIGDRVKKGEKIGLSGDSGSAIGHPHLHCEVRQYKKGLWIAIDPNFAVGVS